ncbi:MAG TPA: hypothetical protein VF532_10750 [Candidatus Angelobacter sp.]
MNRSRPQPPSSALLLAVALCSGFVVLAAARQEQPDHSREVTLSRQAPTASFPLDEQRMKQGKTIVALELKKVDNPSHAEYSIEVTLAGCNGAASSRQAPVGSLGVYPTGQEGGRYALDLGPALKQLLALGQTLRNTCLKMQLKPMRAATDWKRLRVTVSSPQWSDPGEEAPPPK